MWDTLVYQARLIVSWDMWEPLASRAKTSGVDLHSEVMYICSVWHKTHVVLGMRCICCTVGMCCGFALEMRSLNLGSGSFRNVAEISI